MLLAGRTGRQRKEEVSPRRILVAIDLSAPSLAAAGLARQWAARYGGRIDAVYVDDQPRDVIVGDRRIPLTRFVEGEVRLAIRHLLGKGASIHIAKGDPSAAILRIARSERAELIVIGTHGRTRFSYLRLGSVAESVALASRVPVLILHRKARRIGSILVPLGELEHGRHALRFAAGLALKLGVPLRPMEVERGVETVREARRAVERAIRGLPAELRKACRLRPRIRVGDREEQILAEASRHGLLVISARRNILLKEILLGHTTGAILRLSPIPVLVYPS